MHYIDGQSHVFLVGNIIIVHKVHFAAMSLSNKALHSFFFSGN